MCEMTGDTIMLTRQLGPRDFRQVLVKLKASCTLSVKYRFTSLGA